MDNTKKYDNRSPQLKANPISRLFFCWLLPFIRYGYLHDLELKDVYNTAKADSSEYLTNLLERHWIDETKEAKIRNRKPSLVRAIRRTFGTQYAIVGVFNLFRILLITFFMPIVLANFINSFNEVPRNNEKGWYLGSAVILLYFVYCAAGHHFMLYFAKTGMRVRIACSSLIYRKMLKLDKLALYDTDIGKLVNLLSNDVNRFDMAAGFLNNLWTMPIQAAIGTYVMYSYLGVTAFAGIAFMVFQAIPVQGVFSKIQGKMRFKIAVRTDKRVKLMNEITSGIQVIKMYAWEKPFEKFVALLRMNEIKMITRNSFVKAVSIAIMLFTERFTLYVIVITYVLLGNQLTGDVVFSMSQTINNLQLHICILFPMSLAIYAETKISIFRIEEFLKKNEKEESQKEIHPAINPHGFVKLEFVNASWMLDGIVDTLIDISLELKPGSLCCIVGNVGSGKSSLLHLLLRELSMRSGKMQIEGTISYASQEPWLFVSNVKNNILFGQPYYKEKYNKVAEACALRRDFEQLPFGDKSNVGERGVALSGGQKARINLARAVYRDADIYLLDDPLSAVDPRVARHIFDKCILRHLYNKTRILVTHQTQFLNEADYVLVLDNGKVQKFDRPSNLTENERKLIHQTSVTETPIEDIPAKRKSSVSPSLNSSSMGDEEEIGEEHQEVQELIERGSMPFSVYKDYYQAGASTIILFIEILLIPIAQIACNACDLWVTNWTNNVARLNKHSVLQRSTTIFPTFLRGNFTTLATDLFETTLAETNENALNASSLVMNNVTSTTESTYIGKMIKDGYIFNETNDIITSVYIQIYTLLIILAMVLSIIRAVLFFWICMRASIYLHNLMFRNILQATMRFFDTNPSGRILNRFSKDMGAVDEMLPTASMHTIQVFLLSAGIVGMTFIKSPIMIIPTIVLGAIFLWLRKVFMKGIQDLKRLEGTTKAPVFSYVTASLDGLSTIRSANAEDMVRREFDEIQDQHTSTWYLFLSSFEAYGFFMDMVPIIFLSLVTAQFLLKENSLGGDVGLLISQSLAIGGVLQYGMRQIAEVANHMTSVERVLQYTKLDKEGPFQSLPGNKPPTSWPEAGRITFKSVYLRYVIDEEPVLKDLNLEIQPGEKVGIVGRTGAGKSTLIAALFRLAPTDGCIQIDGVDISKVGLTDLRSNISIIPQNPILFSNTIRYNLDPFGKSDDQALWQAIESVELKDAIESLDMKVSEGGSNFSAGQRQLICLARAIVRNNRILVMDEATANVDPRTDALIQASIRTSFGHCTVLTVAHRLNTIMDSDRVIVMDAGQMKEFAAPHELLQNNNGFLSKMVAETGSIMETKLRATAEEHYTNKKA